jgi:hypothetical protein
MSITQSRCFWYAIISALTEQRGLSVEEIVLELIHLGIKSAQLDTYHDLDALAGTWSDKEADDFMRVIADFERAAGPCKR